MKYFIKLHDGSKYEVDELDYNTINGRIATGRYNGYYQMRGKINTGMQFSFKYFLTIEQEGTPRPKDEIVRNIDISKRKPPEVGKPVKLPKGCPHDWANPETYKYVVENVNGRFQYRKQCPLCNKVSSLVKPKEVEAVKKSQGKTLEDVKTRQIIGA